MDKSKLNDLAQHLMKLLSTCAYVCTVGLHVSSSLVFSLCKATFEFAVKRESLQLPILGSYIRYIRYVGLYCAFDFI